MRLTHFARMGALALVATAVVACGQDTASGPAATPVMATSSVTTTTAGLLPRPAALSTTQSTSATIGPLGGTLSLAKVGLTVIVPPGALLAPTKITVSTYNKALGYDFQPHGTVFHLPLTIVQKVPTTSFSLPSTLSTAYVADRSQVDESTMTAQVNEFLPLAIDTGLGQITFQVWHFSGYMLSTGRKG